MGFLQSVNTTFFFSTNCQPACYFSTNCQPDHFLQYASGSWTTCFKKYKNTLCRDVFSAHVFFYSVPSFFVYELSWILPFFQTSNSFCASGGRGHIVESFHLVSCPVMFISFPFMFILFPFKSFQVLSCSSHILLFSSYVLSSPFMFISFLFIFILCPFKTFKVHLISFHVHLISFQILSC